MQSLQDTVPTRHFSCVRPTQAQLTYTYIRTDTSHMNVCINTGKLAHSCVQSVTDNLRTQQSQSLKHTVIHKSGYDIKTFKSANEAKTLWHQSLAQGIQAMSMCSHSLLSQFCSSAGSPLLKSNKALQLILGHATGYE